MSNLENLTSKILEDSKREANEILEKAKKEADSLLSSKEKSAELVKNDLIEKAKLEAESRKQRLISNTRSKLTSALITSTRALASAVSGAYSRVSSNASATTSPELTLPDRAS